MIIPSMHYIPRMNVMLDFICIGLVDLRWAHGKRKKKIQDEKFLPTVGLGPTFLRFVVRASTDWAGPGLVVTLIWSNFHTKITYIVYIEVWLWRVPDQVECSGVFCMLKANTGLLRLSAIIDIFQYITQCTRQNTLYFIIPRTNTNVEEV